MFKLKLKYGYLCLLMFIVASLFYININGLPLSHPGNIKAADGFYHALTTEGIIETRQWNYYPVYFSLGQEKAVNSQPPLYYLNSAILTLFSNIPVWVTLYFIVAISQAFFVIFIYLITKELFENAKAALLSASLAILPLPIVNWLYGLYIGFWLQVPSYMFIFGFLWLFLRFIKNRERWTLFIMGLCLSSIMLLHIPDLVFLLPPTIWLAVILIKDLKNPKELFNKTLLFALIPSIIFLILTPRILFVWGSQGRSQTDFGFYGFNRDILGDGSNPVFPHFNNFPFWIKSLFFIGLIVVVGQLIFYVHKKGFFKFNFKKSKLKIKITKNEKLFSALLVWLFITLSYFFIIYLTPVFLKDPYYIGGRSRAMLPFIIYPYIGFILYAILDFTLNFISNKKFKKITTVISVLIFILIAIIISIPTYNTLNSNLNYEHLSLEEWQAYRWLHDNTNTQDKILFFDATSQSENIYTKRITASFTQNELQSALNKLNNNVTTTKFEGGWGGGTVRASHKYEKSILEYGRFEELNKTLSIFVFDYIIFQDLNANYRQINDYFASQYVTFHGFGPVYDNSGYLIIKNERKN